MCHGIEASELQTIHQEGSDLTVLPMCLRSVLLLVRVSIAAVSGSLSIIVTTLDAVLDVISGFIIWSTSLARRRKNKYRFPIGQVSTRKWASVIQRALGMIFERPGQILLKLLAIIWPWAPIVA